MDKIYVWICYAPQAWKRTINKRKGCRYTVNSASKAKLVDRQNTALKTTNKKVGVTRGKHELREAKKHERREKGVPLGQNANIKCDVEELFKKQKQAAHTVRTQQKHRRTKNKDTNTQHTPSQSINNSKKKRKERNIRCMLKEENEVQQAIVDGATEM
jgi:hypothetical protein